MKSTYDSVAFWNTACSKLPPKPGTPEYWGAIKQQWERCFEEVMEINEAIENRDLENLMKEGSDLDYVTCGLNFMIGADYNTVMDRVIQNNMGKVTRFLAEANQWRDHYTEKGEQVAVAHSHVEGENWYCVKRLSDDKVMKSPGLQKPDLSDLVPKEGD